MKSFGQFDNIRPEQFIQPFFTLEIDEENKDTCGSFFKKIKSLEYKLCCKLSALKFCKTTQRFRIGYEGSLADCEIFKKKVAASIRCHLRKMLRRSDQYLMDNCYNFRHK